MLDWCLLCVKIRSYTDFSVCLLQNLPKYRLWGISKGISLDFFFVFYSFLNEISAGLRHLEGGKIFYFILADFRAFRILFFISRVAARLQPKVIFTSNIFFYFYSSYRLIKGL